MRTLAGQRSPGDARASFELASASDSTGDEAAALQYYQQALQLGLPSDLQRRATIQLASTLRNLGHPQQGLQLLLGERERVSDILDDALLACMALLLADLGRPTEALASVLPALARHLPRYQRSMTHYAAALLPPAFTDDGLALFASQGAPALPATGTQGHLDHDGSRLWYASLGAGPPVILLHGGLGNAGNWGHQVPALLAAGYRVILIDSRGHGRSTRDAAPFGYDRLAADVLALIDHLALPQAALIGWSDGACTALVLAAAHPERVSGVLFFGCNMDPSGALPFVPTPAIDNCFARHRLDHAALSATPDAFMDLVEAVGAMQRTQPNFTAADLAAIAVPVRVVQAQADEFIRSEHAHYLAATIPGAQLTTLAGVSHFAPLQRPGLFNAVVLGFLGQLLAAGALSAS
ncbi:MAG: tetratricopeptide repeat protein [Devosia sp.]